jgi:two-component system NarL family response regulator
MGGGGRRTVSLVVADDHELVLDSISHRLAGRGHKVLAQVTNARDAIVRVQDLRPDVALIDLGMLPVDGLTATLTITKTTSVPVIIFSGRRDRGAAVAAAEVGARGFVTKGCSFDDLEKALLLVAAGERYLSDNIVDPPDQPLDIAAFSLLTRREQQVLRLVAKGKRSWEIGEHLGIAEHTVEVHRGNVMRKLNLHTTAELAVFAAQWNLV